MRKEQEFKKWAISNGFPMGENKKCATGYFPPTSAAYQGFSYARLLAYKEAVSLLKNICPYIIPLDSYELVLTQIDNYIFGLKEERATCLELLWFFLPAEEPCNPHTTKANEKEKNKRWHEACGLYQKHAGSL